MVAIPSHLTDKTNSLKSNTTILESHSKHLMYGPNTCLCAVLSGTWTGSKSWVDLVCCEVCNPCLIASGSGEFWGQCDAFDLLSHLNNSRAVLAVWRGALVPPPTNWLFLLEPASSCRSLIEVFLPTEGSSSPVTKRLLIGNGRIVFFSLLL